MQGEGLYAGNPMTFVRLAGCNLQCRWCDTKWALDPAIGETKSIQEIVDNCSETVCVTGGEPLLQDNVVSLLDALTTAGHTVHVETNGTYPPPETVGQIRWTISPKFGSSGHEPDEVALTQYLGESHRVFKLVYADADDWQKARALRERIGVGFEPVIVQPDGRNWRQLMRYGWKHIADWRGIDVRLIPQIHVAVFGSDTRE